MAETVTSVFGGHNYFLNIAHFDLIVIDEDATSALFDQEPIKLKAGRFNELLPHGRKKPAGTVYELGLLGERIDQGLSASEGLHAYLRNNPLMFYDNHTKPITPELLRETAKIRRRVEQRPQRIVFPTNTPEEVRRAAAQASRFIRISVILERLAVEMEAGCSHCGSLQLNADGVVEARGLKPLWDMSKQKVLILDGTANTAELCKIFPNREEVRIDVERSAYFIKVRDTAFAKSTCLRWDGKKRRFAPTPFLERAYSFIDFFAARYRTLIVTTKAFRCAMTGEDPNDPGLPTFAEFRGALITHYGNLTGLNHYADCRAEIQIGRELIPAGVIEDAAVALNHADPEPIKRLPADAKGNKKYSNRTAKQLMRDGSHTQVELTCHEDERVDWRRQAMCEAQLAQGYDRLRLCDEDAPAKLVVSLVSIPTEQPVDVMPTLRSSTPDLHCTHGSTG